MSRPSYNPPYSVFAEFYDVVAAPLRAPVRRAHEEIIVPLLEGLRKRREREARQARPGIKVTGREDTRMRGREAEETRARDTIENRGRDALGIHGRDVVEMHGRDARATFRLKSQVPRPESLDPSPESRITACDLCCGTGTTALEMARRGYKVYAVDRSPEMLEVARAKFARAGADITIVRADMRSFRLPEPVDLITCEFDAINHLEHKRELRDVARAASGALRPGGWFFFDANTRQAFEKLWVANWILQGDGYFMTAHGGYDKQRDKGWTEFDWFVPVQTARRSAGLHRGTSGHRAAMRGSQSASGVDSKMRFRSGSPRTAPFRSGGGTSWRRFTEHYEEVAWTMQETRAALGAAGLKVVGVWDFIRFTNGEKWAIPGCRYFWLGQKLSR